MFDLSLGKLLVIGVVALFLVGPEKLPAYAATLGRWVRVARGLADQTKQRMAAELGPEFADVDWASLDPRRYHPRRLLLDAWNTAPSAEAAGGPRVDARASEPVPAYGPDLLALEEERAEAALRR